MGEFRAGAVAQVWGAEVSALSGGVITLALVAGVAVPATVRRFRLGSAAPEPVLIGSR